MANEWYKNKWGWGGVILLFILSGVGILTGFPILQAFGALLLVGTFPLIAVIYIPLILGGWFLGILTEKIYKKIA
jgi:hypothetical protein